MIYNKSSRRLFLQGIGGFTLAIPFLESLAPRAHAATGENLRFIGFVSKNGQRPNTFFPTTKPTLRAGDAAYLRLSDLSGPISGILGSEFNALKSKLSVLRGLDMLDVTGHNRSVPFTASHHIQKEARDKAPRFPYSIDAVLENSAAFNPMRLKALRLGPYPKPWNQSFSYFKRNGVIETLPYIENELVAFKQVFGVSPVSSGFMANATDSVDQDRRNFVINRVFEDYKRVMGSRGISSSDKQKLSHFADLVNDLQKRIEPGPVVPGPTPGPGASPTPVPTPGPTPFPPVGGACKQPSLMSASDAAKLVRNHCDILIAAIACGKTNVATLACHHVDEMLDPSYDYVHEPSHATNGATHDKYNAWIAKHYAHIVNSLNAIDDGNGRTILDNSVVMWANELSIGESHYVFSMPTVVAGSAGGQLRQGHYIDYSRSGAALVDGLNAGRPYNELLITMMQALGLAPGDYQKDQMTGFGTYDGMVFSDKSKFMAYYSTHLANKNQPLPYFWNESFRR